jgi:triphosphatase
MGIELEVKFRMERETWLAIKHDYEERHVVHRVEQQTNQYFDTLDRRLGKLRIGLRLRLLDERTILSIKRDTMEENKRQEVEEMYEGILEKLPVDSPALRDLLQEVGCLYEELAPLVMLRTERTIFKIEEAGVKAEACFDDVTIIGRCREHKLYEVEFELLEGSEERLLALVNSFRNQYGKAVQQSSVSKLGYAMQLVE